MSTVQPELTYSSRRERIVRESMFWGSVDRLLRNPQGIIGLVILGLLVGAAVFAPLLTWHHPNIQDASARFLAPSWEHPFGTDELRRDLYSRTLYGLRVSLALSMSTFELPVLVANDMECGVHEKLLADIDKTSKGKTVWRVLASSAAAGGMAPVNQHII